MIQTDNTPTVILTDKSPPTSMSQREEYTPKCKFCGDAEDLNLTAILTRDADDADELDPKKVLWLCDKHYEGLIKSEEYRIRELPRRGVELGHSSREKISEGDDEFVVILEPENENKWLKAPDNLEIDLTETR